MGFAPVLLPVCFFIVFRRRKTDDSTVDSGDQSASGSEYIPLLATRTFWTVFCVVVGTAATWALGQAIWDAMETGLVSLPGRRGHPRPVVPWPAAWAYFLGTFCIAGALLFSRALPRESDKYAIYGFGATLITCLGYLLFFLSYVLTSLTLIALFIGVATAGVVVIYVERKYGRAYAVVLAVASIAFFIWALQATT